MTPGLEPAHRTGRNLSLAIVTGLLLAGSIFGTLFTSRVAWFFVVCAAVLLSQWELYRVLRDKGHRPAEALGLPAGAALLLGALVGGSAAVSFALTLTVIAAFLWFLVDPDRSHVADGIASTLLGALYVPFLGAHVVLMRDLPHGPALTVSYIGLVAFYDIAAFAFGVKFGKHRMAPSISPKKSWEGTIGATLFIFVLAVVVGPFIDPFTAATAGLLALVVALVAPVGDLAESLLKRDLGVKDMGTILPGHGGMLDRIDALLLVAPAAYWLMRVTL